MAQEEIRFAICPECYVSMLLCERMQDNEAILMVGCRQYSAYTGYLDFAYAGPYDDLTPMYAIHDFCCILIGAVMQMGFDKCTS